MNKIAIKYIIITIIFYTLYLAGIPFVFSRLIPTICENISYNSEFQINIKNPKLRLNVIPVATIKADEIKINAKQTNEFLILTNPKVKFRILPLLSGKLHINKLDFSRIEANSLLKKKPELDAKFFKNLDKLRIECNAFEIKKFYIAMRHIESDKPALYSGEYVKYKNNSRFLQLNMDSKINIDDKKSEIKLGLFLPRNNDINKSTINININNLDLEPVAEYLKNFLPKDLHKVNGALNVNVDKNHLDASLKNCSVYMNDEFKSMIFPDELNINADFDLTRKNITIHNANVKSKNIDISLSGNVADFIGKHLPFININIRINTSKIEDFISFLPAIKTEDFDIYKLKKYKFFGNIIGNITVKGNTKEPSILGNVYISNGILTKPIPKANGASVKLNFIGKYLNFDVFVPAGLTERVWVKGGVELYNVKYADMHIWSTQNVDLATAEEKVNPLHEILNFVVGPVPIMNVKGTGNIDITVKGNRKDPHVWGGLNFYNVTTYFNEIKNLVMNDAEAVLTFDDENAVFTTKRGFVNGKPIDIKGTCNLSGKFDFDVSSNEQSLNYLYNAVKTSSMIEEIKQMIPDLDTTEGLINLKLKVFGNVKYIENLKFNKNYFTKGKIDFLDNTIGMNGIKISNTKGFAEFDCTSANVKVTSYIGNYPLSALATVKNNIANLDLNIPKVNLKDILPQKDSLAEDFANIIVSIQAKYKGKIDNIEYNKINFISKIISADKNNKLKISNGMILLKNDKLQIKDIRGNFVDTNSNFYVNLTADNINSKPLLNGKLELKDFELPLINMFGQYSIIPKNIREIINTIKFDKGKINLKADINKNTISASTDIGGIVFTYTPLNMPIHVINGSLYTKRNYLGLNKINIIADNIPILIDGIISNITSKPNMNLYINTKPKQEFVDRYINKNALYPIKLKGDIVWQTRITGIKDDFNLSSQADLQKDSSIYYLGATIGDIENAIVVNLDMNIVKQNLLKIKEFSYDKIIASQGTRKTRMNMLKAEGGIDVYKDDLMFHNLKIKTKNPTDARIFNIIFRKPNIKQGQFTSDLKINGKLSNPKLIGNFHIFETNIPFLDTTMKNITIVFKDKLAEFSSSGEVLGNDVIFKGTFLNKLTPPYYIENVLLQTKILDLNYIINKLKTSMVDEVNNFESFEGIDLSNLIIKNIKLNANIIKLRNLSAENVEANASINDKKQINVKNFKFNVASGMLSGNYLYNLDNNQTSLNLTAKDIDANDITYAIFDLNNQLYGSLTGEMKLSCNGSNFEKCMQTLSGNTTFNVTDGKMPKLGSLEYLLRAGNLIKGGFTSLSINSVIDIITPLKTGEFSNIYGLIQIQDGIANNIEIATKGKNLSLFLSGTYNFSSSNAEMEVLGMLSKKISTMFGAIGNVSLNTLLNVIPGVDLSTDSEILQNINKIPGIELSDKAHRKFVSEIKGNINGNDYVTSFKWIN